MGNFLAINRRSTRLSKKVGPQIFVTFLCRSKYNVLLFFSKMKEDSDVPFSDSSPTSEQLTVHVWDDMLTSPESVPTLSCGRSPLTFCSMDDTCGAEPKYLTVACQISTVRSKFAAEQE